MLPMIGTLNPTPDLCALRVSKTETGHKKEPAKRLLKKLQKRGSSFLGSCRIWVRNCLGGEGAAESVWTAHSGSINASKCYSPVARMASNRK